MMKSDGHRLDLLKQAVDLTPNPANVETLAGALADLEIAEGEAAQVAAHYRTLFELYLHDMQFMSARQHKCLIDDIDAPMLPVVGAFALLGLKTAWSCCGFDYEGQPIHKAHEYGKMGLAVLHSEQAEAFARRMTNADIDYQEMGRACRWFWRAGHVYGDDMLYLNADIVTRNAWPYADMIHYSEPGAIMLGVLKRWLLTLADEFEPEAEVVDYNHVYLSRFPDWQYPPSEPWHVTKAEVLRLLEGGK